jgi:hypothetical protein
MGGAINRARTNGWPAPSPIARRWRGPPKEKMEGVALLWGPDADSFPWTRSCHRIPWGRREGGGRRAEGRGRDGGAINRARTNGLLFSHWWGDGGAARRRRRWRAWRCSGGQTLTRSPGRGAAIGSHGAGEKEADGERRAGDEMGRNLSRPDGRLAHALVGGPMAAGCTDGGMRSAIKRSRPGGSLAFPNDALQAWRHEGGYGPSPLSAPPGTASLLERRKAPRIERRSLVK